MGLLCSATLWLSVTMCLKEYECYHSEKCQEEAKKRGQVTNLSWGKLLNFKERLITGGTV